LKALNGMLLCFTVLLCANAWGGQWVALGPDGGDVRSLAYDPRNPDHIFLGTSTGTIFQSSDLGHSWIRFTHFAGHDYVIDHILIDPGNSQHIYVGAWSLDNRRGGELFRSYDGGKSWRISSEMHGKSIRAMAVSISDPNVLVVGALDGVFRTKDGGQHWQNISRRHIEIKNVESIAIDPKNADVVYAGTWHLAWKTTDGGTIWHRIQDGMVDDSDVFSIIVDESNSQIVFGGACSGIYRSLNGGHSFDRIQGIPFSARRTHVLKQDPNNPAVIYAGTTEGLWVTGDSGMNWRRVTNPDLVINDVLVDPRDSQRVLLATDRGGVLVSRDAQQNFVPSNFGFAHRYVSSILVQKGDPDVLYVAVVNDREFGGVFVSYDAGRSWNQRCRGLDGRDVFVLKQANKGTVIAGTNHGIFALAPDGSQWMPLGDVAAAKRGSSAKVREIIGDFESSVRVNDIEITPTKWLAATSAGLYVSSDEGKSWSKNAALRSLYLVSVRALGDVIVLATPRKVLVSADHGKRWRASPGMPLQVNGIQGLTTTADGQIIVASREGAFRTHNFGARWDHMHLGLPSKNITCVTYDESHQRLLATSAESTSVFESRDGGHIWHRSSDTGYPLRALSVLHGRLVAATTFDGIVIQSDNVR